MIVALLNSALTLSIAPRPGDAVDIFCLSDVRLAERPEEMHGWEFWSGDVRLGPDLVVRAEVQVTSKGNGSLSLLNLDVKVIGGHVDSDFYEPTFLYTFLVDLNSDGYRDLVVCGRVWETYDECDCAVRWRRVVEVLEFDGAAGVLVPKLLRAHMGAKCSQGD